MLLTGTGKRLKQIRQSMNLTQADFAEKLEIQQQTLSRYEKNRADIPDKIKIKLHKMDIDMTWLLTGVGNMYSYGGEKSVADSIQLFKELGDTHEIDLEILFMLKETGFKAQDKRKLKKLVEFGIKAIQSEGDIEFE